MRMFGRELTLEQVIGFVRCNAAPNEDLVHSAALELIAALQEAERRAGAAVCDIKAFDTENTTWAKKCKYSYGEGLCIKNNTDLRPGWFDVCHPELGCWQWRGPQEADV